MQELAVILPSIPGNLYDLHYTALRAAHGEEPRARDFIFTIDHELRCLIMRSRKFDDRIAQFSRPVVAPGVGPRPFSLVAQPTYRRRHEKKRTFPLKDKTGRVEWLREQGKRHGFNVLACEITTSLHTIIRQGVRFVSRDEDGFEYTTFTGVIDIVDPEKFENAMAFGIGRGKAFGLGLIRI